MLLLAALPLVLAVGCGGNEVRTTDNIARECALIPFPRVFELQEGGLYLDASTFAVDSRFDNASKEKIREFASLLSDCSGTRVRIKELAPAARNGSVEGASLSFVLDDSLSPEEYSLDAGPRGAVVRASDYNSVLYSLATLRQLLPVEIYCCSDGSRCTAGVAKSSCKGVEWTIPFCHIEDYPQYSYRGVMLDCSRHFFTVDEVKRFLDIMAEYKLNRFHWHLTDDQGWRVEIKKYPQLTEVGSVRGGTMVGRDFDSDDGVPHGGFYTQDELRDVVAYAQELGITIVPEVDLPGHMVAALASYPELGCTGGPYEVRRIWGIADDVLCAGKDATYRFLDDVINEIADIFPGELFHIGGDECPKVRWENCPDCQAKIAELGLADKDGV
ncbi:MAG: beta-N-acetylhexosaminidase, partial [Bacteroidales bacterium]|nr:beta-N-acetylhexosaminidase [Bacteroidales bacterium]